MAEQDPDAGRVWKLMEEMGTCMLASHEGEAIRARPMAARPRQSENVVYFLTSARGHKDEEIEADAAICLTFADPGAGKFLVVTGQARVLNDRALINALWVNADSGYWTSAEDPDIRVIKLTPVDAQFWEGPHGVLGTVATFVAAAAGGVPLMGDQRKIQLS